MVRGRVEEGGREVMRSEVNGEGEAEVMERRDWYRHNPTLPAHILTSTMAFMTLLNESMRPLKAPKQTRRPRSEFFMVQGMHSVSSSSFSSLRQRHLNQHDDDDE
ncbi:hypothetical protein Tco_0216811 [Tanacetum coccineum]